MSAHLTPSQIKSRLDHPTIDADGHSFHQRSLVGLKSIEMVNNKSGVTSPAVVVVYLAFSVLPC